MAKVMVSIPDDLLEQLDAEAQRRRTSRSALLQDGARKVLGRPDRAEIEARLERIRAWADEHGGSWDSAETIRAERDWLDERDRTR